MKQIFNQSSIFCRALYLKSSKNSTLLSNLSENSLLFFAIPKPFHTSTLWSDSVMTKTLSLDRPIHLQCSRFASKKKPPSSPTPPSSRPSEQLKVPAPNEFPVPLFPPLDPTKLSEQELIVAMRERMKVWESLTPEQRKFYMETLSQDPNLDPTQDNYSDLLDSDHYLVPEVYNQFNYDPFFCPNFVIKNPAQFSISQEEFENYKVQLRKRLKKIESSIISLKQQKNETLVE
eukprot:TRINITY_DN3978_c0_g1_i1.p1 TRINITY_DN3978_c0_g1~~TRINITY_DN3978_c0_g1_i1.p1  ORF type:complete len:232 (+),score=51.84 TRINITY_DN3978_c0_g1_i1:86-781(+)